MAAAVGPGSEARLVRFGTFELSLDTWELRNKGARVKIEGQPLRLLAALLERPGDLVTREELKQRLWPDDTFVDFDHSINAAVKRLREALNDSAASPRFIETLPRRGYRFVCPLNGRPDAIPVRRFHRWALFFVPALVIAFGVILLTLTDLGLLGHWLARGAPPAIRSVAVLPLENLTGDAAQGYVVDGLHEEVITELQRAAAFDKVIARTSVLRYKDTDEPLRRIAQELGVDGIVEGGVRREGERVRVSVKLVHAASETAVWGRIYDRDLRALSLIPAEIVSDVTTAVAIESTGENRSAPAPPKPVDPDAYLAYLKAKEFHNKWTNDAVWQAVRLYEHAIEADPAYAPAWAAMGTAYEQLATVARGEQLSRTDALTRAKVALQRAVELDPGLRVPHQALARIKRGEGDWEGAAREFQRAREVDPKWLGPETYLLNTGRYDEAVAASRENAETNPFTYSIQLVHGWTCFWAGRYDESIEQLKKTIDLDPRNPNAHYVIAWSYVKKGMPNEAVAECDRALALLREQVAARRRSAGSNDADVPVIPQCGWVYASTGRRAQALEIAGRLPRSGDSRSTIPGSMGDEKGLRVLAKIYDAVGDRERALTYLRELNETELRMVNDRMFSEELRADPRFQEIARKQPGFPPATGALAENRARARALRADKGKPR